MAIMQDVDLDDLNLCDVVEIYLRVSFSNKLAKTSGYVAAIDEKELVLLTYDPRDERPPVWDRIRYNVKDVMKCDILKKNK